MSNSNPFGPGPNQDNNKATPNQAGQTGPGDEVFDFDFSEMALIPEGTYEARCIDVHNQISKAGNPMAVWDFVITVGEHAGFSAVLFTVTEGPGAFKLKDTCGALDLMGPFTRSQAINLTCLLEIEHSEYQGRTRESIRNVFPSPHGKGHKWTSSAALPDNKS